MSLHDVRKGDKVIKLMNIAGIETAAIVEVAAVCKKRKLISTDISHVSKPSEIEPDGVCTYRLEDGRESVGYIPGCSSRLIYLE